MSRPSKFDSDARRILIDSGAETVAVIVISHAKPELGGFAVASISPTGDRDLLRFLHYVLEERYKQ